MRLFVAMCLAAVFGCVLDHCLKALSCCCRQAKAEYEGELKLRSLNNDHVGAKEWDWVWSMLQAKEGSITATANPEQLAKAQDQASNTGITVPGFAHSLVNIDIQPCTASGSLGLFAVSQQQEELWY